MLDARSGLQVAYTDMEDEIDEFINFDTEFTHCPRFYTELISLAQHHGRLREQGALHVTGIPE